MTIPILQLWSAPKCQTGAQPLAALPASVSGSITESLGGNESGTITLDTETATAAGLSEGRILRAVLPLRGVQEWVITQVSDSIPGTTVTATLGPLRQLLALRGFVRETTAATTTLTFRPDPLTVSELLTRYVLTNLAADGLEWLSLGTIEYTDRIDPGTFSAVRRGELLTLIERITGYEVVLRRLDGDAGYAIDVVAQRGSAVPTALLEVPGTALQISRTRDLANGATAVLPVGDDERPMGEVDWTGGAAIGTGPYWIPLTDPAGGAPPIREDGQFAGTYLLLADGTTLPITTTRASDSAVQVAMLGTYTTGQRVLLVENSQRRPVSLIPSPSALAEARGLVVARVSAKGARYERTLNRNAGFEDGSTQWNEVNGTGQSAPLLRTEFGQTLTFQANGARTAGTSAAIAMPVDGLAPNSWLRRGDWIVHQADSRPVSATAQSTATGVLTLSVGGGGLPTALADGNTLTLTRKHTLAATSAITMPRLGGLLYLNAASVGTYDLQMMLGARRMTEPSGATFTGPNGDALDFYPIPSDSSRIAVRYRFTTNDPASETVPYTRHVTAIAATGVQELTLTLGDDVNVGTPTVNQWVRIDTTNGANWSAINLGPTQAPWLYTIGAATGPRLIGQITSVSATALVVSLVGYPTGADFRTIGTITAAMDADHPDILSSGTSTPVVYGFTNTWASGATFTLSRPDTSRAVQVDGAYSIGATSITTKPITAISTRAWQNGDTLFVAGSPPTAYAVTGAATHNATTGIAAVPVSVPSGVTLARGTMVWSNAHGDSSASALRIATTVTGPASAVDVFAGDTLAANETDGGLVAAYRVLGGTGFSALGFPGNELLVWQSVQANGSGACSVFLGFANASDIADNATLTVVRPTLFGPRDRLDGSALRLFFAPGTGTPGISVTAVQSETLTIPVTSGESVTLRAVARFRVSPETLAAGTAPVVAIVNTVTGTVLATGTIASSTTYTAPYGSLEVTCTTTLSATASIAIRIYGGSNTLWQTRWHVCTDASLYVGPEVLPYVAGARSRVAFQRGQDVLEQRRRADRYQLRGLDTAALVGTGTPLQLGQPIRLRAPAAGIDTTQRLVRLVWRWPGGELVEVEAGALTPRLTDVTVSL